MSDHLIVQIVLRWGLGIVLVLLGVAGIALMGFAGAMSDSAPDADERASENRWTIGCGVLIAAGVGLMIFL
jgi:hypothetical protein